MATALPLSAFYTIISLLLRGIFNASNSTLAKFFSIILPVCFYDDKAESPSLLLINSLSKLKFSKELVFLYNSLKDSK